MSKWIPVTERKPTTHQVVLVTEDPDNVDFCYYDPIIDEFGWYAKGKWLANDRIIAWQDLPEAYKPETDKTEVENEERSC